MGNFWLWAVADLGDAFRRHSERSNSLSENWIVFGLIGGIVLLWLALNVWEKYRKRASGKGSSPKSLFAELCHVHQLSRVERALLQKTVEQLGLSQPAFVFVEPRLLMEMADNSETEPRAFSALGRKLFGRQAFV